MKQPQVRELDLLKGGLQIAHALFNWQDCDVTQETLYVHLVEKAAAEFHKKIKRFIKEQGI